MNRKIGNEFVRAWTNYYLFARRGKSGQEDLRYRMVVVHGANVKPDDITPAGFEYVSAYGGFTIEEAWNNYYKNQGMWCFFFQAATDPAPA